VDVLLNFFKNNVFTSVIIVVGLLLVSFAQVTESSNQLLRTFGLIHTYDVGQESARGRFSSALVETAWNRLFWMRNYAEKVKRRAPIQEQDKSWDKFMSATEKWSSNIMNYYIGLDEYYKDGKKRRNLEYTIQPMINRATALMVNLRYSVAALDSIAIIKDVAKIHKTVDSINYKLYSFVDQPPPK
jgi:hypothetical protein